MIVSPRLRGSLLAFLLLPALLLSGCGKETPTQAASRAPADTLVWHLIDEVRSLDPHKGSSTDDSLVIHTLFSGLTRSDGKGGILPGLAERWTVSADGLTYTFTLRPHLSFSNATPLRAQDVVFSFRRVVDPATASPSSGLYLALAGAQAIVDGKAPANTLGVAALDARTVVFKLIRPMPTFLELLTHASATIVSQNSVTSLGENWVKARPLVVSGPYQLTEWVFQNRLSLAKNPHYFDADTVQIPKVRFLPISDIQSALRRFEAGEIDVMTTAPNLALRKMRRERPQAVRISPYRGTYYFVFNTRRAPFSDVRVRQALTLALDRSIITDKLVGTGVLPSYRFVPPVLGSAAPVHLTYESWPMSKRLARAKALLKAAGYGPDKPLRFELRFNTHMDHRRVALAATQMWKPLGVQVTLTNSESSIHFATMRMGDFELARAGWIADFDDPENFLSLFTSGAGSMNYAGYANPHYDRLIRTALAEPDPARRTALLGKAEELLLADAPIAPIYTYVSTALLNPRVQNWQDNPSHVHPVEFLSFAAKGN